MDPTTPIANQEVETFKEVISRHVHVGSTVWTDDHPSYGWLENAGYPHESVLRLKGEFTELRGSGVEVFRGWQRVGAPERGFHKHFK